MNVLLLLIIKDQIDKNPAGINFYYSIIYQRSYNHSPPQRTVSFCKLLSSPMAINLSPSSITEDDSGL